MRRLLLLLFALGALIGLFGQEVAFASGAAWQPRVEKAASMPDPCMNAMGKQPAKEPCKGVTLDCIAAMGCLVPLLSVDTPVLEPSALLLEAVRVAAPVNRLTGREPPPERQPPIRLI